mmetsp:Transcript_8058/g.16669  ORF Transcript_8058/g.16669 Transcript_8058/m.16669 type:complete len:248 (+) Transcript_8058:988-1731(+)
MAAPGPNGRHRHGLDQGGSLEAPGVGGGTRTEPLAGGHLYGPPGHLGGPGRRGRPERVRALSARALDLRAGGERGPGLPNHPSDGGHGQAGGEAEPEGCGQADRASGWPRADRPGRRGYGVGPDHPPYRHDREDLGRFPMGPWRGQGNGRRLSVDAEGTIAGVADITPKQNQTKPNPPTKTRHNQNYIHICMKPCGGSLQSIIASTGTEEHSVFHTHTTAKDETRQDKPSTVLETKRNKQPHVCTSF